MNSKSLTESEISEQIVHCLAKVQLILSCKTVSRGSLKAVANVKYLQKLRGFWITDSGKCALRGFVNSMNTKVYLCSCPKARLNNPNEAENVTNKDFRLWHSL